MNKDIERILFSEKEIIEKCLELGKRISIDYQGECPILVGLLKGCVPFLAELIKHINIPMEFDFMDVDSYHGGTISTEKVIITKDLTTDIANRHVLIIEDIIDTGITLDFVVNYLKRKGCKSIEVVTLVDKPAGRKNYTINPKYIGFTIEKHFIVGFGLDYQQLYRNLPYIGILKQEVYE